MRLLASASLGELPNSRQKAVPHESMEEIDARQLLLHCERAILPDHAKRGIHVKIWELRHSRQIHWIPIVKVSGTRIVDCSCHRGQVARCNLRMRGLLWFRIEKTGGV